MRSSEECKECIYNQAKRMLETLNVNSPLNIGILVEVKQFLDGIDLSYSPMEISQYINKLIQERTGVFDPYLQDKNKANKIALNMIPVAKNYIEQSEDPVYTVVKISIAGNIIDYGISNEIPDLQKIIEKLITQEPAINDYGKLYESLSKAQTITILVDNAGEVIFDLLMVEVIQSHFEDIENVNIICKNYPFLNDITVSELKEFLKLEKKSYNVFGIENQWGKDYVGSVKEILDKSDVIISKGQGNFEIFYERYSGIYYMFLVKCPIVGNELDISEGHYVIKFK